MELKFKKFSEFVKSLNQEKSFKKYFHLMPKYEELIGPVASWHASLEKAMNEYIFVANPNLKKINDLHFRFELATKIIFQMPKPFQYVMDSQEAFVGLNKLRNHLVHPTKLEFKKISALYDPIFKYIEKHGLDEKIISDAKISSYEELMKLSLNAFGRHVLGSITAQIEIIEKFQAEYNPLSKVIHHLK